MPNLERRTIELLQCMQRRQLESETGFLDIKEIFSHWAFDFTVCASPRLDRTRNFLMVILGGRDIWRLRPIRE